MVGTTWYLDDQLGNTFLLQTLSSIVAAILALVLLWIWRESLAFSRNRKLRRLVRAYKDGLQLMNEFRDSLKWSDDWNSWNQGLTSAYNFISPDLGTVMEVDLNQIDKVAGETTQARFDKDVLSKRLADLSEYLKANALRFGRS